MVESDKKCRKKGMFNRTARSGVVRLDEDFCACTGTKADIFERKLGLT